MYKWLSILLGILLLALSLNLFLEPNSLIIGGTTGIAIILKHLLNIPLSLTNLALNIPLLLIAGKIKGINFVKKTFVCTILLSLFLQITSYFPPIKTDLILSAVYGGLLSGLGTGLILKGEVTTGGSDLMSVILNHFYPHIKKSNFILVIDQLIVFSGVFILKLVPTLYSVIAIYIMSKFIDLVVGGISFAKAVLITSNNSKTIGQALTSNLVRGATYIDCKGMYTNDNKGIILIVVSNREIPKLKTIVSEIDKNAFVIIYDVKEIQGNFRK